MDSNTLWADFLKLRAEMIVHYREKEGFTPKQIVELFQMDEGQVVLIYHSKKDEEQWASEKSSTT